MTNEPVRSRRTRNVLLWMGIVVMAFVGLIILISALVENTEGKPVIENAGVLIGTIITAFGALMAALLPSLLRAESNSETIKHEVKNDHSKNMRDDIDGKHDVVIGKMEEMREELVGGIRHAVELAMGTQSDIRGVRRDVGRLTATSNSNVRRIGGLERRQDQILTKLDNLDTVPIVVQNEDQRKENSDDPE